MAKIKNFAQLLFGLIELPIFLIAIFTLANKLLSVLFLTEFTDIQFSPIWTIWIIFGIIIEGYYFTEMTDL